MNTGKKEIVLGIDIGGTNTAFGFVDYAGTCLQTLSIPTLAEQPPENLFDRLFNHVDEILTKQLTEYKLVGIGIGAPNGNYYNGTIENPANLKWGHVNIYKIIDNYYQIPAAITNDANAAALGEMLFGAAKNMKNFIVITLGTGLGSGIVANGQLIYGTNGFAGEIGHTIVDPEGRDCNCGRRGCLETYVSATGIIKTLDEFYSKGCYESSLNNMCGKKLTAKDVTEAAKKGDKLALDVFDYTAKILGLKLADSVAYLGPEVIILCGGLAQAGELLIKPVKKYMERYILYLYKNKVRLTTSLLADSHSSILGAAALIWNGLKRN